MRIAFLVLVLLASCSSRKENASNKSIDTDSIIFAVFSVKWDSTEKKSVIELVSKSESKGQVKNDNRNMIYAGNYLSLAIYRDNVKIDSMQIEHPLYKHFEYLNEHHKWELKDTMLRQAEFFVRFQANGASHLKISETLENRTNKEFTIIKL